MTSLLPAEPKTEIIKLNRVRCRRCLDVITSEHRHHFVSCKCGSVSVDGGNEYLRRVYRATGFDELSEYEEVLEAGNGIDTPS